MDTYPTVDEGPLKMALEAAAKLKKIAWKEPIRKIRPLKSDSSFNSRERVDDDGILYSLLSSLSRSFSWREGLEALRGGGGGGRRREVQADETMDEEEEKGAENQTRSLPESPIQGRPPSCYFVFWSRTLRWKSRYQFWGVQVNILDRWQNKNPSCEMQWKLKIQSFSNSVLLN